MVNRKDLTIRYFEFFDYYSRGAPAPKWMTDGVPFVKKDGQADDADDHTDAATVCIRRHRAAPNRIEPHQVHLTAPGRTRPHLATPGRT